MLRLGLYENSLYLSISEERRKEERKKNQNELFVTSSRNLKLCKAVGLKRKKLVFVRVPMLRLGVFLEDRIVGKGTELKYRIYL